MKIEDLIGKGNWFSPEEMDDVSTLPEPKPSSASNTSLAESFRLDDIQIPPCERDVGAIRAFVDAYSLNLLAFIKAQQLSEHVEDFFNSLKPMPESDRKSRLDLALNALPRQDVDSAMNSYGGRAAAKIYDQMEKAESVQCTPPIIDVSGVDLANPHGLLGQMCDEMKAMAHRRLDLSYPLFGLQALSLLSQGRLGLDGVKLNLFTVIIAPSGSGKDNGIQFIQSIADHLKLGCNIFARPRSDKDMIYNLIDNDGKVFYLMDEVHGVFNSIKNKNAQVYHAGIGDEILIQSTSRLYALSGIHKTDARSRYTKKLSQLEKKIDKLLDAGDSTEADKLKKHINDLEKTLENIENGFPSPSVSLAGASTPANIDTLISTQNIESGLIGRGLVIRCGEERARRQTKRCANISNDLWSELNMVKIGSFMEIEASENARRLLSEIDNFYEQNEYRNHPSLGAVYSRLHEKILAISSVMAVRSGIVTVEDVRYALALVLRHIRDCEYLMQKNTDDSSSNKDIENAIRAIIIRTSTKLGVARSKVKQSVTNSSKQAKQLIEEAKERRRDCPYETELNKLLEEGIIKLEGSKIFLC